MDNTPDHPADLDGTRKFHAAAAGCARISLQLSDLAYFFDQTGNEKMADALGAIADDCAALQKLIREAVGDNLSVMMQRTNESSRNMLMAAFAIAGVPLGGEDA